MGDVNVLTTKCFAIVGKNGQTVCGSSVFGVCLAQESLLIYLGHTRAIPAVLTCLDGFCDSIT